MRPFTLFADWPNTFKICSTFETKLVTTCTLHMKASFNLLHHVLAFQAFKHSLSLQLLLINLSIIGFVDIRILKFFTSLEVMILRFALQTPNDAAQWTVETWLLPDYFHDHITICCLTSLKILIFQHNFVQSICF